MIALKFLIFALLSTVEFFGIISLSFAYFRFSRRTYIKEILFTSFVTAYFSYTLREGGYENFAPMVMIILLFLFLWLSFRIHVFWSAVMAVFGVVTFGMIQSLISIAIYFSGLLDLHEMNNNMMIRGSLQVASTCIALVCGNLLTYFKIGTNRVPHSEYTHLIYEDEKILLYVLIGSTVSVSIVTVLVVNTDYGAQVISVLLLVFLVVVTLLVLGIRRGKR